MDTGFKNAQLDDSWAFDTLTRKETTYASHGYHKYPAKFIPQLVKRLLDKYSSEGDFILDPFGGCGTTLVESKINSRNSICIDVNEAALLIASAKKTAINSELLNIKNINLQKRLSENRDHKNYYKSANKRLKYWFTKAQYNRLMRLYKEIQKEDNQEIRTFYRCCFSNILKNCSIWYSKSIKPMRDPDKKLVDPKVIFTAHLNYMTKQNSEYYNLLTKSGALEVKSYVKKADARATGIPNKSMDLIITSPPYAISYEYADIHQLSLLWFGFTDDIKSVRKNYIGSSYREKVNAAKINSPVAIDMINALNSCDPHLSNQISHYIIDLESSFKEMFRVLRRGKRACIIIGDTKYKGIDIKNKEIAIELLKNIGFDIETVIRRKISSKTFTPYRDSIGRFSQKSNGKMEGIYQYEYIIVAIRPELNNRYPLKQFEKIAYDLLNSLKIDRFYGS